MKIGILTYHRAENYGALLQAYATMTYLRSLGHEVSFVDYWPKYHSDYFKVFSLNRFLKRNMKGKLLMLVNVMMPTKHIRKYRLQRFMHEKLNLANKPCYTDKDATTEHYDAVIYGSDQIWRKQHLGGVEYDKWYFGSPNVVTNKKIVYAGSMGKIDTTVKDDDYVKSMMTNFIKISVRENDLKSYLNKLGVECTQVIDPVFLLTKEQWRSIMAPSKNRGEYILFYNLLDSREARLFAEKLAKKKGLRIIEINKKTMMGKGYIRNASVERFLQLINDAAYVVSNSFHGVAFSIIFEKQFFAVGMQSKASRVLSLLDTLTIQERYIEKEVEIEPQQINYQIVSNRVESIANQSKSFLKNTL